jgi:hypothetical protein
MTRVWGLRLRCTTLLTRSGDDFHRIIYAAWAERNYEVRRNDSANNISNPRRERLGFAPRKYSIERDSRKISNSQPLMRDEGNLNGSRLEQSYDRKR